MDENERRNGDKPASKANYRKWTVMVYLAGDNNLTANCITVLQQLEAVKYKRNVRVLACFDSNTPWPKGSRYLAINCKWHKNDEEVDWEIYNDLIITEKRNHKIKAPDFCTDDKPSGSPMKRTDVAEGLKRFMAWAMKHHHKSNPCMLVLYGHGPVVAGKTFLAQDNPLSSLSMTDIPKILEPHFGGKRRNLDILAFQNCAMNGIETAYELRNQVDYIIGSQGLVLSYGWPYERIIGTLVENPDDTAAQISEKILKACARHLIDFAVMDRSSEQSVCDVSKFHDKLNITAAIRDLSLELKRVLDFKAFDDQKGSEFSIICDAVKLARLEAQSYWGETFVDVYDFCERLLKKCNEAIVAHNRLINDLTSKLEPATKIEPAQMLKTDLACNLTRIMERCMAVMDRVKEMVPYSYYIGPDLQYSRGLSIYFPWSMPGAPYTFRYRREQKEHVLVTAFETYSGYSFAEDSGWADFLKSFYRATLRNVRRADRDFSMKDTVTSLSAGVVNEVYESPTIVLRSEQMQKTDSNTRGVDYEVWSNVKNYPRRNYLSPSDCPRKVAGAGSQRPEQSPDNQNGVSPPVSYLGWNICELVADVIKKKPIDANNGKVSESRSARAARRQP